MHSHLELFYFPDLEEDGAMTEEGRGVHRGTVEFNPPTCLDKRKPAITNWAIICQMKRPNRMSKAKKLGQQRNRRSKEKCEETAAEYGGIDPKVTPTDRDGRWDCRFKLWG